MVPLSVDAVVAHLGEAGLNLSLTQSGGLAVQPSRHLTDELRALIRDKKAQLIDWLVAAKEEAVVKRDQPYSTRNSNELADAYHAHHFVCTTCIAAGRGRRYGQRCGTGMALWRTYCE